MGRVLRGFTALFLLALFSAAVAYADDPEPDRGASDPYEVCRDDLGRPDSWLDRSHSYLTQRLCEPAAWFDGFFGDPRSLEETSVGTFFKLRNALQWDESKGWSYAARLRADLELPQISERLRLFVTRDEDVAGEFRDDPAVVDGDERTRLGLRFLISEDLQRRIDVDGTVRISQSGLDPRLRARYRYVQGLTDHTLMRATQSAFWERSEGFGLGSRLDYEWLPRAESLLRWTVEGTLSEASKGVDWRSRVVGFQQLDQRTAIRADVGAFGWTRPNFEVEEYFVSLRLRRQFLRRWLYFELQPEHAWPLDADGITRRSDWRFTFTLEIQFENAAARQAREQRVPEGATDPSKDLWWEGVDPPQTEPSLALRVWERGHF